MAIKMTATKAPQGMPEPAAGRLTMPSDMAEDFSWGDSTYAAGQEYDATGWDAQEIKNFRDASGATYYSDDITNAFNQYSLDNLGGISQYDFQLKGTGEDFANMIISPEMNRWWQPYGVQEGDYDAAMELYNYYDGDEYDAEGNLVKSGSGINNLAEVDPYHNYTDLENIVGGNLSSLTEWNRGYLNDKSDEAADGSYEIDGIQSSTAGEDPYALATLNQQVFQATTDDAASKGKAAPAKDEGEYNQEAANFYYDEVAPALEFSTKAFAYEPEAPSFYDREPGTLYEEPNIDPDLKPYNMWSYDDLNSIGLGTSVIEQLPISEDETLPSFLVTAPNEKSEAFQPTEGALDYPYGDITREGFDTAISLMGPEYQMTKMSDWMQNDEGGYDAYATPNPFGLDDSLPNQYTDDGIPINPVSEDGNLATDMGDWMVFGGERSYVNVDENGNLEFPASGDFGTLDVLHGNEYTDSFIEREIQPGGILSGSAAEGWTPTSDLAAEYDWDAYDVNVFLTAAKNSSWWGEDWAIGQVEAARRDTEAGYPRPASFYSGGIGSYFTNPFWQIGEALDPEKQPERIRQSGQYHYH